MILSNRHVDIVDLTYNELDLHRFKFTRFRNFNRNISEIFETIFIGMQWFILIKLEQ